MGYQDGTQRYQKEPYRSMPISVIFDTIPQDEKGFYPQSKPLIQVNVQVDPDQHRLHNTHRIRTVYVVNQGAVRCRDVKSSRLKTSK